MSAPKLSDELLHAAGSKAFEEWARSNLVPTVNLFGIFQDGFRLGARYAEANPGDISALLDVLLSQRDYYYGVIKSLLDAHRGMGFFDAVPFANMTVETCRKAIEKGPDRPGL